MPDTDNAGPSDGLSRTHPAVVCATWFGSGLLPLVPGTWGSIAALPFAWIILVALGPSGLVVAAATVFLLGWWATSVYLDARSDGVSDPGEVVVDEVAGQFLALAFADPSIWWHWLVAFILFRLFDIAKPWPARRVERSNTAFAVMADDIVAAGYALLLFAIIVTWEKLTIVS